ncbi:MAG: hypothetical protein FK734_09060 [Asgard group archaeon]|nr:hypothetical protein [Asgard group archaeon]
MAKINKSISKILPYFSISKFGVFNFQYDNVQQFYIENLLELLSCDINFIVEMGDLTFEENKLIQEPANLLGEITYSLNNNQVVDLAKVQQLKEYLSKISEKEIHIWRKIFQGSTRLSKSISRMMRFANDFEEYQHGIMSSYLLMKILNSFTNIQIEYSNPNELSTEDMDVALIYSKLRILQAMANHTSPGYKIRQLDDYSSILLFVDELEEFSRISRANQYRQFINEFCKTELDYIDDLFCVDFIFDDVNVDGLNPEISFKDKAKKFLNIFNIPELAPEFKIRFRCIGRLPQNKNIYELSIAREHFEIKINEKKIDTINYLGTKEAIEY